MRSCRERRAARAQGARPHQPTGSPATHRRPVNAQPVKLSSMPSRPSLPHDAHRAGCHVPAPWRLMPGVLACSGWGKTPGRSPP